MASTVKNGNGNDLSTNVNQMKTLFDQMMQEREQHLRAVAEIDNLFRELKASSASTSPVATPTKTEGNGSKTGRKPGRPAGSKNKPKTQGQSDGRGGKGKTRETRGNKRTGTSIVIDLIRKAGGTMNRSELHQKAEQEGISSSYSSTYSLEKSGRLTRQGDDFVLNEPETATAAESGE